MQGENQNEISQQHSYMTTTAFMNIANNESDKQQKRFTTSPTGRLQWTGAAQTVPAVIINDSAVENPTEFGYDALNPNIAARSAEGKDATVQNLAAIDQIGLYKKRDNYDERGLIGRIGADIASAWRHAGKEVKDVGYYGLIQGHYATSLKADASEREFRAAVERANPETLSSFVNGDIGIYSVIDTKYENGNDVKSETFFSLNRPEFINDKSFYATLKTDKLRKAVKDENGVITGYAPLNEDEMFLAEQYKQLNRLRIVDENNRLLTEAYDEAFATDTTSFANEAGGDVDKWDRVVADIAGQAAPSVLLFELAGMGAFSFANIATKAAKGVKLAEAIGKTGKALKWSRSIWTNPYLLSEGGGIIADGASAVSVATLAYLQEFNSMRNMALAAGWSPIQAGNIAHQSAIVNTLIETVPFMAWTKKYYAGGRSFRGWLLHSAIPESTEEVLQETWTIHTSQKYGLTAYDFEDIAGNIWQAALGGFLGTIAGGAVHHVSNAAGVMVDVSSEIVKLRNALKMRQNQVQQEDIKLGEMLAAEEVEKLNAQLKEWQQTKQYQEDKQDIRAGIKTRKPNINNVRIPGIKYSENIAYKNPVLSTVQENMDNTTYNSFMDFAENNDVNLESGEETLMALQLFYNMPGASRESLINRMNTGAEISGVERLVENWRQDMMAQARIAYETQARATNPKITKKQLNDGWSTVEKLINLDLETGVVSLDATQEFAQSAEGAAMLQWMFDSNTKMAARQTIQQLKQQVGKKANTKDLEVALSQNEDYLKKYDAQWKVATQLFAQRVTAATGNKNLGKALAGLVEKTFYQDLVANPETNPIKFMSQFSPIFTTQATLRRRGIAIKGFEGIWGEMEYFKDTDSLNENAGNARTIVESILKLESQYTPNEESERLSREIQIGLFGQYNENIDTQDVINLIKKAAYEELQLSRLMHNASQSQELNNPITAEASYMTMAIMRLKGMSQTQINNAFGLAADKTSEQMEKSYQAALDVMFKEPSKAQIKRMYTIGEHLSKAGESGDVEGFYAYNQEADKAPQIFLGEKADGKVAAHETAHFIGDIQQRIAEYQIAEALLYLDDGKQHLGLHSQKGATDNVFYNASLAALFRNITDIITARYDGPITQTQLQETVADLITHYLSNYTGIDTELDSLFKGVLNRDTADGVENSLYSQLTLQDKKAIKALLNEHFGKKTVEKATKFHEQASDLENKMLELSLNMKTDADGERSIKIQKQLSEYLNNIKDKTGPLNNLSLALSKAMAKWENGGTSQQLESDINKAVSDAVLSLRRRAYKFTISPLLAKSKAEVNNDRISNSLQNNLTLSPERRDDALRKFSSFLQSKENMQIDPDSMPEFDDDGLAMKSLYFYKSRHFRNYNDRMRMSPSIITKIKDTFAFMAPSKLKAIFNDFTNSIVDIANKIHPELGTAIREVAFEHGIRKTRRQRIAIEMAKCLDEFNDWAAEEKSHIIIAGEYSAFSNYLANHQRQKAFAYMRGLMKTSPEFQARWDAVCAQINEECNRCYDFLLSIGKTAEELGDRENYFPSKVQNHEAFTAKYAQMFAYDDKGNLLPGWDARTVGTEEGPLIKKIRENIKSEKEKGNHKPDIRIVAKSVNDFIMSPYGESDIAAMHHKVMEYIPPEFIEFYAKPEDALMDYFEQMSTKQLNYELVGSMTLAVDEKGQPTQKVEGLVGRFLTKMYMNTTDYRSLPSADLQEVFISSLAATVNRKKGASSALDEWLGKAKIWQGIFALGGLGTFINQYYELVPMMMRYGFFNTVEGYINALQDSDEIKMVEQIGVSALQEHTRSDEEGLSAEIYRKALKYNGFTKTDILLKQANLFAQLLSARDAIHDLEMGNENANTRRFLRNMEASFGKNMNDKKRKAFVQSVKAGDISNNDLKLFLRNGLAATQPIDAMEIPVGYNKYGAWGRSAMFLTTTVIKEMNFLASEFKQQWKDGKMQFAGSLAQFMLFSAMVGVPIEWLKDILRGRQPNIGEAALFAPLQFFILDRYFFTKSKKDGVFTAFTSRFVPHAMFLDDSSKALLNGDAWTAVRHVPLLENINDWAGKQRDLNMLHGTALNTYEDAVTNYLWGNR